MDYSILLNILLFLAFLADMFLSFLVLIKNPKSEINIVFSVVTFSGALWTLGILIFRLANNLTVALFWNGEFIFTAGLIASCFLHFSYIFPKKHNKITLVTRLMIYIPNCIILCGIFFPNVFIKGIIVRNWGKESILGWGYIYYGIWFALYTLWAFINYIRSYLANKGQVRLKMKYVIIGTLIAVGFGSYFNLFLILLGNYKHIYVGPYSSFFWMLITVYAIVRYRLMDITFVYRKSLITIFYVIITLVISFPVFYWLRFSIIGLISAIVFLIVFSPIAYKFLKRVFGKFVDKTIFRGRFDYLEKLKETAESSPPLYTSGDIAERFTETVCTMMNVKNCSFMMYNNWRDQFRPKAHVGLDDVLGDEYIMPGVTWDVNEPLIKHLDKNKKIIVKEEIELKSKKENKEIINAMSGIKAEVILPVFLRSKLVGVIGIGRKQSKRIFDSNDLNLFESLLQVLERDLSHTHFMEQRTVFSAKVAHDLRSPFGWLVNGIANVKSGIYGKTTKEQKEKLTDILKGVQGLERNIRHFFNLNVLLQKVSHNEYNVIKDNIANLMERIKNRFKLTAEKEGIQIITKIPEDLPNVLMNSEDIEEHVFANLIINALKYTKKGKLTLSAKVKGDNVICCVEDTGKGIPKASLPKVFNPYFHTEDEEKQKGVGLGLVIVKEVVEANGGQVWVESQVGKGTKFYFSLSIA